MMPPVDIPCTCNNGKPCGKVLRITETYDGNTLVTIENMHGAKGVLLNKDGRQQLIDALGEI